MVHAKDELLGFPKVRIDRWGTNPNANNSLDNSEFVKNLKKGFWLHNDGTETALSVQLDAFELVCGPATTICILSAVQEDYFD